MNLRSLRRGAVSREGAKAAQAGTAAVPGGRSVVAGVTPLGQPVEVPVAGADLDLLFLTSDCRECRGCWRAAAERAEGPVGSELSAPPAGSVALVIVTPDPSTDSRRAVARLAPAASSRVTVVMSTPAWLAYGITKAPWKIEIRAGEAVSSGPAL